MKTKIGLFLLFGLFFQLSLNAQSIDGPDWLCMGDCGYYQVLDASGTPMNDIFTWDMGNGETYTGANVTWCPWEYNGTIISVYLNGNLIAEFQFFGTDCCGGPIIIGPSEICAGECADYTVSGGGGGYDWQFSDGSNASTLCTSSPGIYGLTVTDYYGCTSEMQITVFILGTPEIISLSGAFCLDDPNSNCDRVCENTTVTYVTEVVDPSLPINWSVLGAENWVENGNEVTVEWGDPGQGQVSVTVGSGTADWFLSCGTYMNAGINGSDGIGAISVDGPQDTYFVQINDPNNSTYTTYGNNSITYINDLAPGTYTVVATDNNGITQSCSFTINESGISCPAFGVYLDVTQGSGQGCCNSSIQAVTFGNATGPFSYQWSTSPNQTGQNITGICEGTYSVTITDDNGCVARSSVSIYCSQQGCFGANSLCVDILEVPVAAFETNPPAVNGVIDICEGQTVFFDNLTNGGFNYTWDFGDGVSSSQVDAQHTYLSAGTYQATLIARNDCFCADSAAVTIIVQEAFTPEIDCAGTICPGEEVTYTSNADCSIFYWNVSSNGTIISGGSTSDNFITVDWGAGPEGIIELGVDGCTGNYCLETLFENIPIIDDNAEIEGPERVCKGTEVIYSMPAFAGTEFIWTVSSFGTITAGQGTNEITVQWANQVTPIPQQITVVYESCYLGCGGSDILLVNILNEVYIEGPIEACPNQMVTYTCRTPLGNAVQADWTVFNNAGTVVATSAGPTSNYNIDWNLGSGNYIVHADVLNPSNYCIDNFSVFVEVVTPTALPASISGQLEICPGTPYTYTGNSGAGSYDYTWYVSDGGSNYILNGKTVNISWGASPPYTLELTQTNLNGFSCESESISVSPNIINSVSLSGIPSLCYEETGTYTATDYENLDYQWQITPSDAGSIIGEENTNVVDIQWNDPGTHTIQVAVCGVSTTFSVIVYPPPTPVPLYGDVCPGQTGVVSVSLPYVAYEWRNESGTTISTSPSPNLGSGYYEVLVTNNNGCTGNETFFIGEHPQPDVTISTPDFGNFCAVGGSMTLYALESSSGPLDYQWYRNGTPFGTNSSSQVITQEGSYYVLVSDMNGCTDFSNTLGLNCGSLPPGDPIPGCIPNGNPAFEIAAGIFCDQSQYTNTSVNDVANTWNWEFWDIVGGGISYSSLENPMHTWTNAGFNIVVLEVDINSTIPLLACTMATFRFDTIPLAANFVHEGICVTDLVTFTDISTFIPQTNITGWAWDFGDPASGVDNTSALQNPQHAFNTGGSYTITLTVTDLSGCISRKQKTIEIVDPPAADFSVPEQSCEGASLFFQANGSFTNITWDFGDPASGAANVSNINSTNHVYTAPGVYTISLTVENVYGCSESSTEQVTIEANGLNGIINVNPALEVCEGDSVILTAPLADTYAWSNGLPSQSITVFDAGTYKVTIYDAIGCEYSPPPVTIDLIPLPQGQITAVEYNEFGQPIESFYNNYETCYGDDVYLEITNNPNYTYNWSTGEVSTEISFTDEKDNLLAVGTHVFTTTITDVNTGCTNVMGPFTVTVHPIPDNILITSMPAAPVCENTPTVISVSNPDPSYIYIWNTGQVGTSINTFYAGKYFVRATNQFGCEGESNTLEIVPGPNVDLIPSGCHARCNPDTICLPPVYGVSSFQWYFNGSPIPPPEGNDPDFIATQSGEYYVEMISVDGCVTISDILTLDLYDGYGSVQGNVYFDINNNGIIDAADTLMSGIGIILQNSGVNVDTLTSNQIGSFSFSNILSTDYELIVDTLNLPGGMVAIISQASALLFGCDDEDMVEFLIQFVCIDITETISLSACPGETVNYDGTDLNIGDTQDFIFSTPIGCDSTVTVTVLPLSESTNNINLQACTGSAADYNGTSIPAGATMDFTLDNAVGCDSVVTVSVLELYPDSSAIQLSACAGTTADYNGTALAPGTQTDFLYSNNNGCDSIISVIVDPLQNFATTENLAACIGESANYNGTDLPAGTTMIFNYTAVNNCDSTVTVVVAELSESTGTVNLDACENGSVIYEGTALLPGSTTDFTFSNTNGCDSIVTVTVGTLLESTNAINFQACTGSSVNYNGTALPAGTMMDFTFQNSVGCDSVVTVTVIESDQDSSSIQLTACEGTTTDYNGTALAPGTQTDFMFSNTQGCDSIVTVIVIPLPNVATTENLAACIGESVNYNGTDLLAGTTTVFNYSTINNCDSTVTVVVVELPESTGAVNLDACENGSVLYDGTELLPGSTTDFTFANINGCDSIVTVSVGTLLESTNAIGLMACPGSPVDYNGTTLSSGTVMDFTFQNAVGCDSVVTVTVLEFDQDSISVQLTACVGTTTDYNGTALSPGTQTDFIFPNSQGCDSIVTVIVDPLQNVFTTENLAACIGESANYNGTDILAGTSMDFIYSAMNSCDSTVTVIVAELEESSESVQLEACENGSVMYEGTELLPNSTTDFTFTNAMGCDSVVTVFVQELLTSTMTVDLEACDGETVIYDGVPLSPGSSTDFVFTNVAGCDSTVIVQVAELPLYSFDLELSACEGDFVEYVGDTLLAGSTTLYAFSSVGGCDSMMTVTVQTLLESTSTLNVAACDGETYPFNGSNLPSGSSADFVFTNAAGCDSIVTVNVGTYNISETFIDLLVCVGETIDYNGNQLGEGFEDTFILTDQNGCDSLITVSVTAHPDFEYDVLVDPACWNDNNGTIVIENLIGGTGPFQYSIDGNNYQDSTIFENLSDGTFTISVMDDNGCEQELETEIMEIPPLEITSNDPEVPCDFSPVRLELENISDYSGPISYVWENGSVQSFITVDTAGVFAVEISNTCEVLQKQYTVSLAADARKNYFYVPNLFSPNNDGINDIWQIMPPEDMEVLSFELHVFDRWGNLMHTFTTVYDFWDGSFKTKDMDPGVYVWWYQARVVSCGQALEVFDKGDVTVIR